MDEVKKDRIYLDSKLNVLPDYYDRDIIKVLTKNLYEVHIFWGISTSSFDKIQKAFECNKDEIHFKLIAKYKQNDLLQKNKEINLPPFTNNWTLKFEHRIKNLKVEVIAYAQKGKLYSLLHSAEISTPARKPSVAVHKDWINPAWVQESHLIEINGELHIQEGKANFEIKNNSDGKSIYTPNFEKGNIDFNKRNLNQPIGSSGFLGSSGNLGSSSNHLR